MTLRVLLAGVALVAGCASASPQLEDRLEALHKEQPQKIGLVMVGEEQTPLESAAANFGLLPPPAMNYNAGGFIQLLELCGYDPKNIIVLTDSPEDFRTEYESKERPPLPDHNVFELTRKNYEVAMQQLKDVSTSSVCIYLVGHGVEKNAILRGGHIMFDVGIFDYIFGDSVTRTEVVEDTARFSADKKYLVLNSCFSGQVMHDVSGKGVHVLTSDSGNVSQGGALLIGIRDQLNEQPSFQRTLDEALSCIDRVYLVVEDGKLKRSLEKPKKTNYQQPRFYDPD